MGPWLKNLERAYSRHSLSVPHDIDASVKIAVTDCLVYAKL